MAFLSEQDKTEIRQAIAALEQQTDAELVTVLARQADDYYYIPALWAALLALLTPGAVSMTPLWLHLPEVMALQFIVFVLLLVILRLPGIVVHLIPKPVAHWRASNLARRQFLENNLHHTEGESGVLIFVSEAERYVEIIADRGVSQYVDDGQWQRIVDEFVVRVKQGEVKAGFLRCIAECGELLTKHVPATHPKNELPDHLVELG